MTTVREAATVRPGPGSAPWLMLALAGPAARGRLDAAAGDVTVTDITAPQAVPVMVNPLEPAPGYPVQAHAGRLAGLIEAAFGPAEPVAAALRAGLRRAYEDCGWDMRTGAARPGAVSAPGVPAFRQLKQAAVAAARDLGYDAGMQAAVRSFLEVRLDALWSGPAGLFLEGGHPASPAGLLAGRVLVTASDLADEQAGYFLAGVLLLRLAEQLSQPGAPPEQRVGPPAGVPRPVIVVAVPGGPPATGWLGRTLEDLRRAGADTVVTAAGEDCASGLPAGCAEAPGDGACGVVSLLAGRRSAACGDRCGRRPCQGAEVHAAGLLAAEPGQAWFRLWAQALILAFLTGRPVPAVPAPLRAGGAGLSPRGRECLLATVIDAAITARAPALRPWYDPRCLTTVVAGVAARLLAGEDAPVRAGSVWVIPQLRWLHELERLSPFGRDRLRPDDVAPPLDFGLAGLADWPGIRVADRLGALRGHPLAMDSERNRTAALTALLGDGPAALDADLAVAGLGISPPLRLRHVAQAMAAAGHGRQPGWLEVVLSWPRRLIGPTATG